jgi:hypothetical protein
MQQDIMTIEGKKKLINEKLKKMLTISNNLPYTHVWKYNTIAIRAERNKYLKLYYEFNQLSSSNNNEKLNNFENKLNNTYELLSNKIHKELDIIGEHNTYGLRNFLLPKQDPLLVTAEQAERLEE